jgi:hypothetical protein
MAQQHNGKVDWFILKKIIFEEITFDFSTILTLSPCAVEP